MVKLSTTALALCMVLGASVCQGEQATGAPSPAYDPALAKTVGADERGMRSYVLVVLKTGPNRAPAGPERDEMFKGHFANMQRLSAEGKLVLAARWWPSFTSTTARLRLCFCATSTRKLRKSQCDRKAQQQQTRLHLLAHSQSRGSSRSSTVPPASNTGFPARKPEASSRLAALTRKNPETPSVTAMGSRPFL